MAPPALTPPPTQTPLTEAEFLGRYGHLHYELIDGVPVELPMPGFEHGKICFRFALALGNFIDANDLGHVTINDSLVRVSVNPLTLLGPDVGYFSYGRVPKGQVTRGASPVPPELAIEVRSPSEPWGEVITKVGLYLGVGVTAVVVLDAATKSVAVYRAPLDQQVFGPEAELTIPDVLPGFAAKVSRFFE